MVPFDAAHNLGDLTPFERVLLTTDGTVTLMLEQITGEPIATNCLTRSPLSEHDAMAFRPLPGTSGPLQLRTVHLVGANSGRTYVKARTLVVLDSLPEVLRNDLDATDVPLGLLLRHHRFEAYREMTSYWMLVGELCRKYRVMHRGRTTMVIEERFVRDCISSIM
ncbi:chorismate--pyruvate lyase family protein [Mycolicibacterium neoaurum]